MWAFEAKVRSRLWFSINIAAAGAVMLAVALEHASFPVRPSVVWVLGGCLFLSVAGESIYNGDVPIKFGLAVARTEAPFRFWLIVALQIFAGLQMLSMAF